MDLASHPIQKRTCRACGYAVDTVTNASSGKAAPEAGDPDVCLNYDAWSIAKDG